MKKTFLSAALFPASLVIASCGNAQSTDASAMQSPSSIAASGEAVDLQSTSPFQAMSYATLEEPWALAFEPGTGRLFITQKGGTAKLFDPATGQMREVTGLPDIAYGGQGGLGDVAFGPDYSSTGTIYLSWAKAAGGGARRAVVGRGTFSCDAEQCSVNGLSEIWRQEPAIESPGHFSHRIAFSPDGQYMFVSSGDRMQQDPAQDTSNNLGGIVRLLPDGTAATGNPLAGQGSPADQLWSWGQRNILGLQFDADGNLWGLEHGPAGGDELNLIQPGNNYGWPTRSNGNNYSGVDIPDHTPDDPFTKPAISWNPVIAPGGMVFYSGELWDEWANQLLIANLRTTSIARVSVNASANSADEEARYAFPERLRDITEAPDGSLWVIEDGENARLMRLTPAGSGE